MTTILATLAALRMDGSKRPLQERRIIERQARQLAETVDDLLDVSRIGAGKVALTRGPVELADIVAKSAEASTALLDERAHELHVDVPRGLVVDGDQRRLVQVVTNLIGNAAKYTGVAGRIDVTAERQDGMAVLRVRDNGVGIAEELLPRIFDRFTQSGRTLVRSQGGLGLGLSIMRSIVQLHGGAVAALESVHHFRPDFALLDIGLPIMDGYQLACRLKKQRGLGKLSLLAISGYGQASDVERARRAGFAAHITKPIDVERLVAMLERR